MSTCTGWMMVLGFIGGFSCGLILLAFTCIFFALALRRLRAQPSYAKRTLSK